MATYMILFSETVLYLGIKSTTLPSDGPCRRCGNKETALFLYCSIKLVSPNIISMTRKHVRSDFYLILT